MSAERHIISGYGLCKVTFGSHDYFFDVISLGFNPIESARIIPNIFGKNKKSIKGYYLEWDLVLGTLISNTTVTPNIATTRANIFDFLNVYYSRNDTVKEITLVPAYGTESTFEETINLTTFNVITKEAPRAIPHKDTNIKLGQALSLKVTTIDRLEVNEYDIFYRNTIDGEWYHLSHTVPSFTLNGGVEETLRVLNDGSLEDFNFKN